MKYIKGIVAGCVLASALALNGTIEVEATIFASDTLSENIGFGTLLSKDINETECVEYVKSGENTLWGYSNLGICQLEGNLNIRENASVDSKIVGKMVTGMACEIVGEKDGFYQIISGEVSGYVAKEYILSGIEAKMMAMDLAYSRAVIKGNAVNVRQEPSTDSQIITRVATGHELELIEELDEWVKCKLNTDEVYVAKEFVKVTEGLNTAMTMSQVKYGMEVSDVRVDLVEYAQQFLGNPYVWGGISLTKGADCSGFVLSIFKEYGHSLPHFSGAQSNEGTNISTSEVLPGDLLFYGSSASNISHVAIYIGGGQIVHASDPKSGIIISNMNYRTPVKATRILAE